MLGTLIKLREEGGRQSQQRWKIGGGANLPQSSSHSRPQTLQPELSHQTVPPCHNSAVT